MPSYISNGIKYLKINRYDSGGIDRSDYLGQLLSVRIAYDDIGTKQYNILSIQEQDTYYVYGVQANNHSLASNNYEVLNYNFTASTIYSQVVNNTEETIINYTNISSSNDIINYFTSSTGYFIWGNTPNIPITVTVSASTNTGTSKLTLYHNNTQSLSFSTPGKYSFVFTGSNSFVELDNMRLTSVAPVSTQVYVSMSISMNNTLINNNVSPVLTIFNPEFINWDYNDYNPLFGNAEIADASSFFMDVDYGSGLTTPINFDLLISGTADPAFVQDSNYNSQAWSNIRYNGSEYNSYDPPTSTDSEPKGDWNTPSIDNSGYGALPAVEQNKTYMAYFDGVGGTGPELINQTAYFIKYLVDTDGNVVNPEPNTTALYNLLDNFESGRNATIKLISNDPLNTSNPNDNALVGNHPITHVGRIAPLMISETGSLFSNTASRLDFRDINEYSIINTPDYAFQASTPTTLIISVADPAYTINPSTITYANANWSAGTYTFSNNTYTYGNRVKFKISGVVRGKFNGFAPAGTQISGYFRIKKGTEVIASTIQVFTCPGTPQYEDRNISLDTGFQNFSTGDAITFEVDFVNQPWIYPAFELIAPMIIRAIPEYPANTATASVPYWSIGEYLTGSNISVLTSSTDIFNLAYNNLVQSQSQTMVDFGFSPCIVFEPEVGDYIRFEYNPNKVFNVTKIEKGDSNLFLTVVPPVPTGSFLNHFVMYRVINDGTYVVLNVKKPVSGSSFTGIIQPEYISQTLKNNYNDIIQNLTQKGLIQ